MDMIKIDTTDRMHRIDEMDEQTTELLSEIMSYFRNKFTSSEESALNMVNNLLSSTNPRPAEAHRNQIFKAADLLKIKLPSYIF